MRIWPWCGSFSFVFFPNVIIYPVKESLVEILAIGSIVAIVVMVTIVATVVTFATVLIFAM